MFTMIELIVTLAIIGILMAIAVVAYGTFITLSHQRAVAAAVYDLDAHAQARSALDSAPRLDAAVFAGVLDDQVPSKTVSGSVTTWTSPKFTVTHESSPTSGFTFTQDNVSSCYVADGSLNSAKDRLSDGVCP